MMVNRIIGFTILPCMILALFLSLAGVQHIAFGDDYYNFLQSVSNSFNSWKLEIPDIPSLNKINQSNYDSRGAILQVIIRIANFFVGFINIIIVLLNLIINILNVVIQLIQFVFTFIYRCKDFINRLAPQS